ncbi:MAG: hypothetical protein E7458_04535 [Ruminococcaceae bacterium]|nr:hypothetical protein [Oscillospiraceae bacterium]
MVVKPQIGFSYDCRRCEKPVFGQTELFALSRRRTVIRCGCGESALVAGLSAGLLEVEYPCGICGLRHRAKLPLRRALGKQGAALCCPVTDLPACILGDPKAVSAQAAELSLLSALGAALTEESPPTASDILCAAGQMAADGRILCRCGSARIRAGYEAGILTLTCARCGGEQRIPVPDRAALHRLGNRRIILSDD